jgi:hypothetical protein
VLSDRDPEAYEVFARAMQGEEGRWLMRAIEGEEGRRAYAAWLSERGDVRGEALGLAIELAERDDEVKRARMSEIVEGIEAGWWRLVGSARTILGCGAARGQTPRVRFAFVCPKTWEQLEPTAQERVRHCGACRERVVRCDTVEEANAAALRAACISVPANVIDAHADRRTMITGRPAHPIHRWARALFE